MKIYQTLKITLLPTTNNKGTRVKITSLNNGKSKILPYDYKFNNIRGIALKYLWVKDIEVYAISEMANYYLFLIDNNIEI
jgi:hypothetical protein